MIEKIAIIDRPSWLEDRRKAVTASAAGALLGIHPYVTAYGLFLYKKGLIADDMEDTPALRRGRLLEPVAVQMLREDKPEWTIEDYPVGYYFHDPVTRIGATPDVFATDEQGRPGVIQVKSVEASIFRRDWKTENGTIEPPLWIVVQAIIEAKLTGRAWAAVAPLVVGFGLELPIIDIPIHDGIFERIKSEVDQFWKRIDEGRNYDPDYARDGSLIAQLYPQDNGVEIDLSGDNEAPMFVDQLENSRAAKKAAETDEKIAKAALASKLGDAAIARLADGRRISNKSQSRNVECKHMLGLFCSQSDFRVMRLVKGR
jgi:hypothetical protein